MLLITSFAGVLWKRNGVIVEEPSMSRICWPENVSPCLELSTIFPLKFFVVRTCNRSNVLVLFIHVYVETIPNLLCLRFFTFGAAEPWQRRFEWSEPPGTLCEALPARETLQGRFYAHNGKLLQLAATRLTIWGLKTSLLRFSKTMQLAMWAIWAIYELGPLVDQMVHIPKWTKTLVGTS